MTGRVLLIGAGRMGQAMLAGWRQSASLDLADVIIIDPALTDLDDFAGRLNPEPGLYSTADTVVLAVKPQIWRDVASPLEPLLSPDATIVSIAAGISLAALAEVFGSRPTVRVMPTTAVASARGTASLFSADAAALQVARRLFDPIATVVELASEHEMHAATAVSGSAPAYLYAFVEALEAAGIASGLSAAQAARLARSTIAGSARMLEDPLADPGQLRTNVTSPGGTTEAALMHLMAPNGFPGLMQRAVNACIARSIELGKPSKT